ncbi:hypothetical protein [Actinoplanes sp. NPDC049599]|uniref:hypothetical protein n=1 Tax=Actinoplanes sp. NPDC049599 TaxID=3363903 RepID=UPI0037B83ABD
MSRAVLLLDVLTHDAQAARPAAQAIRLEITEELHDAPLTADPETVNPSFPATTSSGDLAAGFAAAPVTVARCRWPRSRAARPAARPGLGGHRRPPRVAQLRRGRGGPRHHRGPGLRRLRQPRLAENHVAARADVELIDAAWLDGHDPGLNPMGSKGIGSPAAIVHAVWHATGVRVRDLPVRLDKLLGVPGWITP